MLRTSISAPTTTRSTLRAYDRRARTLGRSVNFPRLGEEQAVAQQRYKRGSWPHRRQLSRL